MRHDCGIGPEKPLEAGACFPKVDASEKNSDDHCTPSRFSRRYFRYASFGFH